jgi:uncharacterized protein YukE
MGTIIDLATRRTRTDRVASTGTDGLGAAATAFRTTDATAAPARMGLNETIEQMRASLADAKAALTKVATESRAQADLFRTRANAVREHAEAVTRTIQDLRAATDDMSARTEGARRAP